MLTVGLLFDKQPCDEPMLARQLADFTVVDLRDWRRAPERIAERVRAVDVLVTSKYTPTLPVDLATDPGRLRYICHTRGVVKSYFPRALLERGVLLSNWGDTPAETVAVLALSLLLGLLNQVHLRDRLSRGQPAQVVWQDYPAHLAGLRVGLYGCGAIGARMARLCLALGCRVSVFDPWATQLPEGVQRVDSLRGLFAGSDAVSIHCGLSDQTRNSVDAAMLALLPRGGILINTARGGVVDEVALAAAAVDGRVLAGLDVVADESDWSRSPLAVAPAALLTGHGRWRADRPADVAEPLWRLPVYAEENLRAFRDGRPLRNQVTVEIYDRTT